MGIQVTDKIGGKPSFAQWDVDRELIITGATETPQLRFAHPALNRAIVVVSEEVETEDETASWVCKVPNFLMQFDGPLVVSVFEQEDGGEGKETALLKYLIRPRMKPQDYTYEENIGYINWVQMSEAAQAFIESFPTYEAAIEALVADAGQSAQSAAASATAAAGSAGAAALSETNAGGSAAAAAGSAAAAAASVASIGDAGAAQIAAVNQAGAQQVSAVQTKGEEVLASIPADYTKLSADVDGLEDATSTFHGLTDYAGNDFDLSGTPGASDGTCLATKRTGMTVTLNGGNVNQSSASKQHVYLKLTGALGRTISSNIVKAWADGIQLEAGKLYLVTCKHMSGTTTGASYPSISVYNIGSATSIGYAYMDGDTYRRYFTAPDGLVNIILLNPCKDTLYTDYTVFVTLQEVDTEKVPDGYENINLYPMLWFTGGIGDDGKNYARNTSIRTNGYLDFDNLYSIAFTAGIPFYLALYDTDNRFLARSDQTGVIFTDVFKHAYPTAKKFRLEMRGVDGDMDAYSNCVIYGKHSIYGFIDKQDTQKEMADVLTKHRTTSEQYGRTNLTALIVTDVHAEMQRLGALLATMEKWGLSYFDAIINCGDTALTLQSNYPGSYDKSMSYIDLPCINVVGNHDSYSTLGTVGPQATTYNLVIAPIAEQEGLVQPTDAAANSLCYYYYDVNGIRIIALDCMYWNADEATWLETVLADAAASSKPVICVSHYGFKEAYAEWIPSPWKSYPSYPSDMINIAAAIKVKYFMDAGGTFLCWLVGHSHQDNLYRLKPEYGGQLVVTFPSLAQRASNLMKNDDIDAYNFSCGTFLSIDLYQHNIKFLRLGADIDTVGVRHRELSLNYLTGELIAANTLQPVVDAFSDTVDDLADDVDALEAAQPKTVTVTGTVATITAEDNTRYVCGELATLTVTLPASGIVDVVFTSGSTPTVLTVTPPTGQTVKWANGFDPDNLDADTTYEINICNGLGVAASWGA